MAQRTNNLITRCCRRGGVAGLEHERDLKIKSHPCVILPSVPTFTCLPSPLSRSMRGLGAFGLSFRYRGGIDDSTPISDEDGDIPPSSPPSGTNSSVSGTGPGSSGVTRSCGRGGTGWGVISFEDVLDNLLGPVLKLVQFGRGLVELVHVRAQCHSVRAADPLMINVLVPKSTHFDTFGTKTVIMSHSVILNLVALRPGPSRGATSQRGHNPSEWDLRGYRRVAEPFAPVPSPALSRQSNCFAASRACSVASTRPAGIAPSSHGDAQPSPAPPGAPQPPILRWPGLTASQPPGSALMIHRKFWINRNLRPWSRRQILWGFSPPRHIWTIINKMRPISRLFVSEMSFNFRVDQIPTSKDLRDPSHRLIFANLKQ